MTYKITIELSDIEIENFPSKIITITEGCVSSSGVLIALAGHERWMTKNSYMLIHEIRSACWGRYSECQDDLQNQNLLMMAKSMTLYLKLWILILKSST